MKSVLPLLGLALVIASTPACAADAKRLSLEEARQYMLELINRDRTNAGLRAVALDEVANLAAQKHAEEMAMNVYLSHSNLAGKMPDQRYTEAGGVDAIGENTFLWRSGDATQLPLQEPQTFARSDIEAIEATYMAEVPPFDGHKRQILSPYHTHVGIGLGRAVAPGKGICLTNTQEFVDRYLELDAIAQTATAGDKIKISGRAPASHPLHAIAVGREALPATKTREEAAKINFYRRPEAFVWLFAGRDFKTEKDGRFEATIEIAKNAPGVYYLMIWTRDDPQKTGLDGLFIASCRTIVVQ